MALGQYIKLVRPGESRGIFKNELVFSSLSVLLWWFVHNDGYGVDNSNNKWRVQTFPTSREYPFSTGHGFRISPETLIVPPRALCLIRRKHRDEGRHDPLIVLESFGNRGL